MSIEDRFSGLLKLLEEINNEYGDYRSDSDTEEEKVTKKKKKKVGHRFIDESFPPEFSSDQKAYSNLGTIVNNTQQSTPSVHRKEEGKNNSFLFSFVFILFFVLLSERAQ